MSAASEGMGNSESLAAPDGVRVERGATDAARVKIGRILDDEEDGFGFEYEDTLGRKDQMRLNARTYEGAIREARAYLGIQDDDRDGDGDRWFVE